MHHAKFHVIQDHGEKDPMRGREALNLKGSDRSSIRRSIQYSKCVNLVTKRQFTDKPESNTGNTYVKNYTFTYDFGGQWGNCDVVFTCVSGHLTDAKFEGNMSDWHNPGPKALFHAPIKVDVYEV